MVIKDIPDPSLEIYFHINIILVEITFNQPRFLIIKFSKNRK